MPQSRIEDFKKNLECLPPELSRAAKSFYADFIMKLNNESANVACWALFALAESFARAIERGEEITRAPLR